MLCHHWLDICRDTATPAPLHAECPPPVLQSGRCRAGDKTCTKRWLLLAGGGGWRLVPASQGWQSQVTGETAPQPSQPSPAQPSPVSPAQPSVKVATFVLALLSSPPSLPASALQLEMKSRETINSLSHILIDETKQITSTKNIYHNCKHFNFC